MSDLVQSALDEVVRAAMAYWHEPTSSPSLAAMWADVDAACLALFEAEHAMKLSSAVSAAVIAAVEDDRARILGALPEGDQVLASKIKAIVNDQAVPL